jgi:hypothetical protein
VSATGAQSADSACAGFTVPAVPASAPLPTFSSLAPATMVAGSPAFTLTVTGSGFVNSSVVRWNGANRATTFVSATQLQAAISAADVAAAASIPVTVVTPAPGGGTSASQMFSITAAPTILPPAPPNPTVTLLSADTTGATFSVAWAAVSGVASYRYVAAFSDGTASQQGSVPGSFQLRMPYHASGAATSAFICVASVSASGAQSADQACAGFTVPAPR